MSASDHVRGELPRTQLETVTCWPPVGTTAGLLVMAGVTAAALFVTDALRPLRRMAEAPENKTSPFEHQVAAIDYGPDVTYSTEWEEPPRAVRHAAAGPDVPWPPTSGREF